MHVLKRPIITEKSMSLANRHIYTFEVDKLSNKKTIQSEVEKQFGVVVKSVKTTTVNGKSHRSPKTRKITRKPDWKKAIIETDGQKISLFDTTNDTKNN